MSDPFEDELRATMRAHDAEAPVVDGWHRRRTGVRRRAVRLPAMVAAVAGVALVAVLAPLLSGGSHHDPARHASPSAVSPSTASSPGLGPLSCPDAFGGHESATTPWVPLVATTPDSASGLVPPGVPTSAVVCAYLGGGAELSGARVALTGRRVLAGAALAAIPRSLDLQPPASGEGFACPAYLAVTDGYDFLVGLRYGALTEWVSMPGNHCVSAGNGRFTTLGNLAQFASYAYRTGRWITDPPPIVAQDAPLGRPRPQGACDATGRLGQQKKLVPGSPTSVTICAATSQAHLARDTLAARRLAAAFNALPTRPSTHTSEGDPKQVYVVVFRYASGPGVVVTVLAGSHPAVDNNSLQATRVSPTVLRLLR